MQFIVWDDKWEKRLRFEFPELDPYRFVYVTSTYSQVNQFGIVELNTLRKVLKGWDEHDKAIEKSGRFVSRLISWSAYLKVESTVEEEFEALRKLDKISLGQKRRIEHLERHLDAGEVICDCYEKLRTDRIV